jgi:hypothetical protein
MLNRWLLAVPLVLAGFVVVPLVRPGVTPEVAFRIWPLYAIVAVLLFVLWRSPRYWARLTFLVSLPWAVAGLFWPRHELALVWGIASVVLAWWLVHLAARVLTRPLNEELAASGLKVYVKSRTSRLRLEISRDRVRLVGASGMASPHAALRLAIPYGRLAFVQPGTLNTQSPGAAWQLPNKTSVKLSDGPAIRIAGPGQEWLVPVDEPREVAAFIRMRVSQARLAGPGSSAAGMPVPSLEVRQRARVLLGREGDRASKLIRAYAGGGHQTYLVAAFLVAPAAIASLLAPDLEPAGRVVGFLLFGAIAVFSGWHWWRLEQAVRLFEEWPRTKDEPSQTVPSESAAPVTGWSSAYPS